MDIFTELHPCFTRFFIDLPVISGSRISKNDLKIVLIAVDYLNRYVPAVRSPERPGYILINCVICFYPDCFGCSNISYSHLHFRIRVSWFWIWNLFKRTVDPVCLVKSVKCKQWYLGFISSEIGYL